MINDTFYLSNIILQQTTDYDFLNILEEQY